MFYLVVAMVSNCFAEEIYYYSEETETEMIVSLCEIPIKENQPKPEDCFGYHFSWIYNLISSSIRNTVEPLPKCAPTTNDMLLAKSLYVTQ